MVLLDVVRSVYPDVPAVFVDTGMEYPEVKAVVAQTENVIRLRPEMAFHKVVTHHGWPILSKRLAQYIRECKPTGKNDATIRLRKTGIGPDGRYRPHSKISKKWQYLIDAPFKISERCCDVMKKRPSHKFEKKTGSKPFVGMLVDEAWNRELRYLQHGCNAFQLKRPMSTPLAFWKTHDIFHYILEHQLPLAKVYGKIRFNGTGEFFCDGVRTTGCMFCAFGAHLEKQPNRFQQMKETHPKHWDFVINKMGARAILDHIKVPFE